MKTNFITIITIMLLILWNCSSNSIEEDKEQVAKQDINEVDELVEKYKNSTYIQLNYQDGYLQGMKHIEYGQNQTPISISCFSSTESITLLQNIIFQLIQEKLDKGYTPVDKQFVYNKDFVIRHIGFLKERFRKDSIEFNVTTSPIMDPNRENYVKEIEYSFTNIDLRRKAKYTTIGF